MGFGDCPDKVIPKVGLLSPPRDGGTIASRYLTPHALHAAHAVTGAVCVSTACALEGTIAHELAKPDDANPRTIWIEHPSGQVDVRLQTRGKGHDMEVVAGTLRTARPIMSGEVLVPQKVFNGGCRHPEPRDAQCESRRGPCLKDGRRGRASAMPFEAPIARDAVGPGGSSG